MNPLDNSWKLWFHDPKNNKWDIESYLEICSISSIEDFWKLYHLLDTKKIQEGMYFFMKDDIPPLWENEKNINGGCWSYKINKRDVYNAWIELSIAVCINNLIKEDISKDIVTGISISPKNSFCVLKIWINDADFSDKSYISKKIPNLFTSQCIFKSHKSRN